MKQHNDKLMVRLPQELLVRFRKQIQRTGRNQSALFREWITKWVGQAEADEAEVKARQVF